jgi:hypothetical protein
LISGVMIWTLQGMMLTGVFGVVKVDVGWIGV